jgi:hypothetical protein
MNEKTQAALTDHLKATDDFFANQAKGSIGPKLAAVQNTAHALAEAVKEELANPAPAPTTA